MRRRSFFQFHLEPFFRAHDGDVRPWLHARDRTLTYHRWFA